MSLLLLPNELLLCIASALEYDWEINAFSQANRRLYQLLKSHLYQNNFHHFDGSAFWWGIRQGNMSTVQTCLDEGVLKLASYAFLERLMLSATVKGHSDILKQLLEPENIPSHTTKLIEKRLGQSSLQMAVKSGVEAVVRALLAYGVDEDYLKDGEPLIFLAAQFGHLSLVKLFVDMGCHPDFGGDLRCTPLMAAASNDHLEIVQYLLQMGADPNFQASDQQTYWGNKTVIYEAATHGNIRVIQCLIEHGAEVHSATPDGTPMYPICAAIENEHLETANFLLGHMDLKKFFTDSNGQAVLLCIAAACGSESLVLYLLDHGCHPDATQEALSYPFQSKQTALMWASKLKQENIVALLLMYDAGRDAGPSSISGLQAPFLLAIWHGHYDNVKMFLERGVDPNCEDPVSGTPLSTVIFQLPIFKLLLENGADPIATGYLEFLVPPLLRHGQIAHIQALLDREMDLSRHPRDNSPGWDNLLKPAAEGGLATLEFLFQHGFESPPLDSTYGLMAVYSAFSKPDPSSLKFLLQKGYHLPPPDAYDHPTALYCAASKETEADHPEAPESTVTVLLRYGLDINARSVTQCTCLFNAIGQRDRDSLDLLLRHGANPLVRDKYDISPLSRAAILGFTEGLKVLFRFFDGYSREVLEDEVKNAKSQAIRRKKWRAVRILERFYYHNLVPRS